MRRSALLRTIFTSREERHMTTISTMFIIAAADPSTVWLACLGAGILLILICTGVRFIPNDRAGIIEKLWSFRGSVGEGRIMAGGGQAGYEPNLLRGGF